MAAKKKQAKRRKRSAKRVKGKAGTKRTRGRRHTPAERANILAAAKREGLSGPAAAKKFGISTLTFYNWRKKAGKTRKPGAAGRPAKLGAGLAIQLRSQIRETLRAMIPDIVREEIQGAMTGVFGKRLRRRR